MNDGVGDGVVDGVSDGEAVDVGDNVTDADVDGDDDATATKLNGVKLMANPEYVALPSEWKYTYTLEEVELKDGSGAAANPDSDAITGDVASTPS